MNAFARLEDLFERVVENSFVRATRSRLQPIEIAKRAAREMERHKTVSVDQVIVPNRYDIWLSATDYARLAPLRATVQADVARYLLTYAARQGYRLTVDPQIALAEDHGLKPRQIVIDVYLEDPISVATDLREEGVESTKIMPAVAPEALAPMGAGTAVLQWNDQTFILEPGTITIGRSLDNTIVLDDKRISRYHARLRHSAGHWTLSDVGSTNGTFVGGKQIKQRTLLEGDLISFGGLEMTFRQTWNKS